MREKELKKQLKECQKLKEEYLNGWKKARADFLNYKKEEMERTKELIKFSNEELIFKILPILDNFELIEKRVPKDLKNNEYIKGIFQVRKQLTDFLKSQGAEVIECLDKRFDPNFQEAVEEVKAQDSKPGIVVEEVKKGYLLHGKVIRPAQVKISK